MVPSPHLQYIVGWSQIGIIVLLVMLNMSVVLYNGAKRMKLLYVKVKNLVVREYRRRIAEVLKIE